jgi:hypothetical protein
MEGVMEQRLNENEFHIYSYPAFLFKLASIINTKSVIDITNIKKGNI